MQLHPFLAPDDEAAGADKRFSESEVQQLLSEEKQRFESALQNETAARLQAEATLREREGQLHAHEMRMKAQEALKSRQLPEQLIGTLNLENEDVLARTLTATEAAFRAALEEGVRTRLRGQAPGQTPLPQKARKTRTLSYQEAAANFMRDRQNT